MPKYRENDHVRVMSPTSPKFDQTFDVWAVVQGVREILYIVDAHTSPTVYRETELILAERVAGAGTGVTVELIRQRVAA